jgi:hypothetical protein
MPTKKREPVTVHVIGPGGNVTEAVKLTPGVPLRLSSSTVLLPGPDDAPPAAPAEAKADGGGG